MSEKQQTDILIIGQGLAGTMLSYHLRKMDISHIVVDVPKEGAASRAAAGLINPIVVKRMVRTWRADEFHPYAHNVYTALQDELGVKFYYPMPLLKIFGSEDQVFWNTQYNKENLSDYISLKPEEELPTAIKQTYGFGQIKHCARIDMATMLDAYRQSLLNDEQLIESEFNENDLIIGSESIQWKDIEAKKIIFCRGSFDAQSRFFKHLKWNNTKGELLHAKIDDLDLKSIVSKGVFVMPVGNGEFKIGATYSHRWDGLEPTHEKQVDLLNKWYKISDSELIIKKQLTGIRPTFNDRRPVAKFLENQPVIGIFNGLGSRGGLMAPKIAKEFVVRIGDALKGD